MRRTFSLAILLALASASPGLQALGLAEPKVHSSLGEPLNARIALNDLAGIDPSQLQVRLADAAAFEQVGLPLSTLARSVRLALSRDGGDVAVVASTEQVVREPYLDLLLTLTWPSGEQRRQVTLLFDPPGYAGAPSLLGGTREETPAARPAPMRDSPAVAATGAPLQRIEVQPGDTLWGLAERVREGTAASIEQAMLALQRANPEAFPDGNINALRAGTVLDVPPRAALTARDAGEARRWVGEQYQAWQAEPDVGAGTAPAEESRPRLTLLSDAELAAERAGSLAMRDVVGETFVTENDVPAASNADAQPDGAAVAERQARLAELEANWQASQEALAQVRRERDHLEGEIDALRQDMAELRELLVSAPTSTPPAADVNDAQADVSLAEERRETAWWRGLWQGVSDNLATFGGIAIALLLALMVVVRRRERARARHDEAQTYSYRQVMSAGGDATDVPADPPPQESPAPIVAPVLERAPQAEAINEADIFIAYGRYGQARELLEQSLESDPGRDDLRLKLLNVYVELGERQAAEREAGHLEAHAEANYRQEAQRLMERLAPAASESPDDTTAPQPDASSFAEEASPPAADAGERVGWAYHSPADAIEAAYLGDGEPAPTTQASASVDAAARGEEPPAEGEGRPADAGRIIDYEPPSLDPAPDQRRDELRQPSVEYPGRLGAASTAGASFETVDLPDHETVAEPEWDVEEVAFEPLDLDNEQPATGALQATPEQLLDRARRRLDDGEHGQAGELLHTLLEHDDDDVVEEARFLIERHNL